MDRRPELQPRTRTLWEQLTTPDPAIRDFLKMPHEDDGGGGGDADRRPCTLMDAIGRESRSTISWKPRLRNRFRLRRDATARSTATGNRRANEDGSEEEEEESKAPSTNTMSLMALMEQADNHWDDDDEEEDSGASASDSGAVEEENGEGRHEQDDEEETARACCVCMVRHKGAAFIPCGHTFCRLCSRDLWLTRASCPLCNAFIHDVLHIF